MTRPDRTPQMEMALKMFDFVFELPWPQPVTKLPKLDDEARAAFKRFDFQVDRLLSSLTWTQDISMTLTQLGPDAALTVDTQFPHEENLIGFATTFRQCYIGKTGFHVTLNALQKDLRRRGFDDGWLDLLSRYRKAHSNLQKKTCKTSFENKLFAQGLGGHDGDGVKPETLFETYAYGDWLHADDPDLVQRLEEWSSTPISNATMKLQWLEATSGFVACWTQFADSVGLAARR